MACVVVVVMRAGERHKLAQIHRNDKKYVCDLRAAREGRKLFDDEVNISR